MCLAPTRKQSSRRFWRPYFLWPLAFSLQVGTLKHAQQQQQLSGFGSMISARIFFHYRGAESWEHKTARYARYHHGILREIRTHCRKEKTEIFSYQQPTYSRCAHDDALDDYDFTTCHSTISISDKMALEIVQWMKKAFCFTMLKLQCNVA